MKTLQSTSRGRGGGGRGRGGGGRGRARGGGGGGGRDDKRFASRFTDPRFQLSRRANQSQHRRQSPREQLTAAARSDPRFAKHLKGTIYDHEAERDDDLDADEREESDEEVSSASQETDGEYSDVSSGEEVDGSEGDQGNDDDDDDDEVAAWAPDEVEFIEPKHRMAIVNCDWDHVRAVDLYAILSNALPLGGQLKDVCVYMSDFGKRMVEHERMLGPDLWVRPDDKDVLPPQEDGSASAGVAVPEAKAEDVDVPDSEDEAPEDDGWEDDNPAMLNEEGEDGELFSSGKYRKYEMDRMKYYYAVATFDSPDTAAAVYNELDGMDIEASGVVLDLRYIDDDEEFESPVSRADSIPPRFKPLSSFRAAALSNTRFRISWDQDDVFRHQSVQDSFTGTTEEDDLAAYLAPPDSDEDDDVRDSKTGRTKAEEKSRIRRKYAALLEEIGGLPEDGAEGAGESDDSDGSDSDDDSLNRFSDVETDSAEEEEEEGVSGDMEGTLDLEAGTKAIHLQRDARLKQKLKDGNLAAQAELKYKQRRKEMKKAKKERMIQEREMEKEALAASKDEQKRKLKALIGTDDDGAVHLSGKEKRKMHAKEVKQRLAEERVSRKQMRMANSLGVTREAKRSIDIKEAEQALEEIDPRFKSKLLTDSRFHLEVATKDKRISEDVQELAATVAKARRGKRSLDERCAPLSSQPSAANTTATTTPSVDVESAVDYFLSNNSRPAHKKARRA